MQIGEKIVIFVGRELDKFAVARNHDRIALAAGKAT